jgi:AcrR family transcriptional regulator
MKSNPESRSRKKTREEILTAAKELFDRRGVYQPSMQDIAEACDITRTTLYDYYRNKDEILDQVAIDYLVELYTFEFEPAGQVNGFEKLRQLVHSLYTRFRDKEHIMRFMLAYFQVNPDRSEREEDLTRRIRERQNLDYAYRIIEEGIGDGSITSEKVYEKMRVVMEHLLALGYRYSLRKSNFIGWTVEADHTLLRRSIDVLLELMRPSAEQ